MGQQEFSIYFDMQREALMYNYDRCISTNAKALVFDQELTLHILSKSEY